MLADSVARCDQPLIALEGSEASVCLSLAQRQGDASRANRAGALELITRLGQQGSKQG